MKAQHQCTREGRTARYNLPVCHHSKFRRLLEPFIAPATRLHRYRMTSVRMLERSLDKMDNGRCA